MKKIEQVLWNIIWILLAGCFASLAVATFNNRILFSDGVWWFFNLISRRSFAYDSFFTRYADVLFQIPALLALHVGFDDNVVLKLYSVFYNFNPFFSLLACGWILKKRDRLDLLIFPIFSFATVTQTTLGDPSGMVSSLLSFVWPLFFLTVLKKRGVYNWAAIVLLVLCFALEHETGVIFLLMLTALQAFETYKTPAAERREPLLLCGLFLAASLWLIYRAIGPTAGSTEGFVESVFRPWDAFRKTAVVILIAGVSVFLKPKKVSAKIWLGGIMAIVAAAVVYWAVTMRSEPEALVTWNPARGRTCGILFASVVAFCCYVVMKLKIQPQAMKHEFRIFLTITCIALGISLVHDFQLNSNWQKSTAFIKSKILSEPGCEQLSSDEYYDEISKYGFYDSYLPLVSLVLSKVESGKVGKILYNPDGNKISKVKNVQNFCCLLAQGKFYFSNGMMETHTISNYDLTSVVSLAKAKSAVYGCENSAN